VAAPLPAFALGDPLLAHTPSRRCEVGVRSAGRGGAARKRGGDARVMPPKAAAAPDLLPTPWGAEAANVTFIYHTMSSSSTTRRRPFPRPSSTSTGTWPPAGRARTW
jgi:hypothetical protein